jgi:prepilin-type processing-associated H-X9-DG protein
MAPDKLGGRVQGSAYIKSREISGTSKETRLESGTLTTCDLENPHYCFSAEKMEIYPGSRIIAYKVSIYGKDKRLVTFERLAIPIRGLSTNLIPQVGSSAEEGMYLKAAYPYMGADQTAVTANAFESETDWTKNKMTPHSDGANIAFIDGHVKWMKGSDAATKLNWEAAL